MTSRTVAGSFARIAAVWLALCTPALAQDVERTFADADALFAKNEYAAAIKLLQSIPETVPYEPHIRKHVNIVSALANLGRMAEAPAHIQEARAIARAHSDVRGEARAEIAEGNYRRWTGERRLALGSLHRAVELAGRAGDRGVQAAAYARLAVAYQDVEDWSRATHYGDLSFALHDAPTLIERFNRAAQRGIAYFELYERDAAEAEFQEALALARESGGKRNESFALGELGFVYWTFDKDEARAIEHYDRAVALAEQAGTPDTEATWRLNRANIRRDTGQYDVAIREYEEAIAVEKAKNFQKNTFAATKNIGQTYRLMGRLEDALKILEPLVAHKPGNPSLRHQWQAHMELASTYDALSRRDEAAAQFSEMLDIIENQRKTAILDSFRTGSFVHTLAAYDPYERYVRFLAAGGAPDQIADAFQLSERARARGFLEMLASVRASLVDSVPASLLDEEQRIMRGISDVQRRLRAADLPKADRDALGVELAAHEKARDAFRLKLRVEHPALAETRYPDVAGPRELQPIIRDGETVVSFFLSEPDSFRWTLTRDRISFHRLPGRQQIEAQTERLRQLIRAPGDQAAARHEAGALAAMLLTDLDLASGDLVVIPHGVLHYVPFEILPHGGQLLIERHATSYAPSLNSLAFLRRQPSSAATFRLLAVGAPSLDPQLSTASVRAGEVENVALLGPLPSAIDELDAIRRTFRGSTELLQGHAARESALRRSDLGTFRVLHFATHGLVSETHPSRSALLFSPEDGEDGLLQMGDIYRLGLNADLVVLSACQTALGQEVTGEGIVGLTRAFFYGGSRAVIATLWNLNDRFAAEFVERFYRELSSGRSSQEALRQAKLAYVNDARYGHPFYWSSMVLAGDGGRVLYTAPFTGLMLLPWAAAAVILLGMMLALRARRAKA